MYFTSQEKYNNERVENMQQKVSALNKEVKSEKDKTAEADYFSLETNDNSLDYYYGKDIPQLITNIKEGIYRLNANPEGNKLTGYPPMNGTPFTINKVKVLNHRWIIADYSNGKAWGEVLIKYFVEDDGRITYETIETLLHTNTVK